MKIQTSRFGDIDIDMNLIYKFPAGIPGFEELTRFIVITLDGQEGFSYLQPIDQGEISFIIVDPFEFFPNYSFDIPEQVITELDIQQESEVIVFAIATVKDEVDKATVNLVAPVIMNLRSKLGKQVILINRDYETRHPLFQPLKGV